MGQVRPDVPNWNNDVQAVPVPMAGVPSRQAELSPRTGQYMGAPHTASSFTDSPTQAYTNQYEASTPMRAYQNSYQMPPSVQNAPMATGGIAYGNSYQPRESYPPTGATAYPADPMAPHNDPAVVARRDDHGLDYRPGGTGTYHPEAASRQALSGAARGGPAADYRTGQPNAMPNTYPNTYPRTYPEAYPAANVQGASAAPAAAYPAPNAGASTQYPQSGTARLNGVIERPTVRTTYDSTRSSLY